MKSSIIKKGHFYKGLWKDSYNRNELKVKNRDDNNLLDTLKKHSQFQNGGFKNFENSEF